MRPIVGALAGSSSLFGEDKASNYGSFVDGSNGGYGFLAWDFDELGGGAFLGSTAAVNLGNIDTDGTSFGLYANPAGNSIDVKRNLPNNLSVGYALSATLAVAYRNGNKGMSVYSDTNWGTEVFNINVGGGGGGGYYINGVLQSQVSYTSQMIIRVEIKRSTLTSFDWKVSMTGATPIESTTVGTIRGIKFYNSETENSDPENNLYVNSLKIYKIIEPQAVQTVPLTGSSSPPAGSSTYTIFMSYE